MTDPLFAYYVHDLNPTIIQFTDRFGLHWYGLAYVLGFIVGIKLLQILARKGYGQLPEAKVADFVVIVALFGVMIGGRLGYMLLYRFSEFRADPLMFFRVMEGGMASHGGVLGIIIVTFIYARRHHYSWPGLGDHIVVAAPVGIFFGRIANFINGELYGRITSVPWAVKFPGEYGELDPLIRRDIQAEIHAVVPEANFVDSKHVVDLARENEQVQEILAAFLNPRHPSQIYAALLEGLLLFLILLAVRLRWKNLRYGVLTSLFFIIYALVRIFDEFFREPDAERILAMTRGQFYSLFMVVIGVAFLIFASRQGANQHPARQDTGKGSPSP